MPICQHVVSRMLWGGSVRPPDQPCTEEAAALVAVPGHPEGIHVCRNHFEQWAVIYRPKKCAKCGDPLGGPHGGSKTDFWDEVWPYQMKVKGVLHLVCLWCYVPMLSTAMSSETAAMASTELPDGMLGVDKGDNLSLEIPIR